MTNFRVMNCTDEILVGIYDLLIKIVCKLDFSGSAGHSSPSAISVPSGHLIFSMVTGGWIGG